MSSLPTMEDLVQAFTQARDHAEGHATATHAGIAAVLKTLYSSPYFNFIYELEEIINSSRPQLAPPKR